jgi:hypothetical protein
MRQNDRVKVRVWAGAVKAPPPGSQVAWKTLLFTGGMLMSAVGLVLGGGWIALRLIVNPSAVSWLSRVLPVWNEPINPPRTLDEIDAEVTQTGRWLNPPIYFNDVVTNQIQTPQTMLLPIFRPRRHCGELRRCGEIDELRVYRFSAAQPLFKAAKGPTYELVDRISVNGPEELSAIASLNQADITQGTTRTLPLTSLQTIDGKAPTADFWFHLSGEWKRGTRVLYGQVIRYDSQQRRLYLMQNWSSPAGQLPHWQQVTGSDATELVVNQSLGLEPQFQIYQLKSAQSAAQPVLLEAIVLTEAALSDQAYVHGLLLARKGLWSPAQSLLQTVQQRSVKQKGQWSPTAQAQLDLIRLHAEVTQTQAERDWASPTQQILAQFIDGRWSQALKAIQSAHASGYDVQNLLHTNVDRLWPRLEVALRVTTRQPDLQQWGVLVLAVKQNREQAVAWLKKQSISVSDSEQTLALLEPASTPTTQPEKRDPITPITITPASLPVAPRISALIGTATALTALDADWMPISRSPLSLPTGQRWYQIRVIELQDGQAWRQSPFAQFEKQSGQQIGQPFNLGNLTLQIVAWQGATPAQTVTPSVRAVRLHSGELSLLVAAPPLPSDHILVAVTPSTVHWVQPLSSTTLNHLAQNQPTWKTALSALWQDLQTSQLVSTAAPDAATVAQMIGDWSIQTMELTGDSQPEVVLTIEADEGSQPRTVIFSNQGQMIYSDLHTGTQSIVAMLERDGTPAPTLIVSSQQGLRLQRWSGQQQRFE